jgi:methylene-tetrahydromethanopterin dehydrogenase
VSDLYLLHIFSPTKYVSPFDINMAYEANFDAVIPYCDVQLDEVHSLTQDTIFSRRPEGVKRTGIFIGGRELDAALDMLDACRSAMVPPFEISVMADPSGAITTASAMAAMVECSLQQKFSRTLVGTRVFIFGGTGPVGTCVALLCALAGADVSVVSHQGLGAAQYAADRCARRYGLAFNGVDGSSVEAINAIMGEAEVVFNTARAGLQVIDEAALANAGRLLVAADANAVPPSGIARVEPGAQQAPLDGPGGKALGIGALAIGDIKYRVHTGLLGRMHETDKPVYLSYPEAFEMARAIVAERL